MLWTINFYGIKLVGAELTTKSILCQPPEIMMMSSDLEMSLKSKLFLRREESYHRKKKIIIGRDVIN